jgi:hypothetical protein
MIAPNLYPFCSLLWEYHGFTPTSSGMLLGHRTSPGDGNMQHSVLLNAVSTVVSVVTKLWTWCSTVWNPVWARDPSLLKTISVAHPASYSMVTAWFWTINLIALSLRISGGKTLHRLVALFCCQMCKKPDPQRFCCATKILWLCLLIQTTGLQATAVQPF